MNLTTNTSALNGVYTTPVPGEALSVPNPGLPGSVTIVFPEEDAACASEDSRITAMREENQRLKILLANVQAANKELKETVNLLCSSPSQKRLMMSQLQQNHRISRRNACRLLGLARSTCWYRSGYDKSLSIRKYLPRTPISPAERLRLLKHIAQEVKNGQGIADDGSLSFVGGSLRLLGLQTAASLVQSNLGLAMEIFEIYLSEYCGKMP
jgi:hypothetical protein